jgi:hypothetical protein
MALALLLRALPRAPAMVARRTFHYAPLGLMAAHLFSVKLFTRPHFTDSFACCDQATSTFRSLAFELPTLCSIFSHVRRPVFLKNSLPAASHHLMRDVPFAPFGAVALPVPAPASAASASSSVSAPAIASSDFSIESSFASLSTAVQLSGLNIDGEQPDAESYELESMVKRRRKKTHRHKYRKRLRKERNMEK